ncbi:hypothetical protein CTheo_642 [Ceratobasidium theobromae]|uniref:Uncharacterized protein n=1 Tax=Ceratobasidium theobromae TaxID=1582974 RepID=A0A5N5QW19_9AGAM|nr:hypothetical protein CTheo_642 [Ceratobasidium theobromae]
MVPDYACGSETYICHPWYIRKLPQGPAYVIQGVHTRRYIALDGIALRDATLSGHGTAIWNLDHQFADVYIISQFGTRSCMAFPNSVHNTCNRRDVAQRFLWKFEKIRYMSQLTVDSPLCLPSDTLGDDNPLPQVHTMLPCTESTFLDNDSAHLFTDMLFNMPRTPFTRAQRIAALDWARKLGASNVPTIDSFEEYEQGFGNQGPPGCES